MNKLKVYYIVKRSGLAQPPTHLSLSINNLTLSGDVSDNSTYLIADPWTTERQAGRAPPVVLPTQAGGKKRSKKTSKKSKKISKK